MQLRIAIGASLLLAIFAARALAGMDALPEYQRVSGISGTLSSTGSDTLANLMTLWTEAFKREYPNVNIQVQAAGSSTAPTALTERTASFGPMSRAMKDAEIQAFEARHGYKPTVIRVAIDALAVYVHKDNPLPSLSVPELDAIFSVTRRCGHDTDVRRWGQLGLTGTWERRPIQLYGRNSVSGTYGFFKQVGLCSGDFKNRVNEQPGSASVVQGVTASLNGIGYTGIGYATSGVRALPIAEFPGGPTVAATAENAVSGDYPLSRFLYIYVNKRPGTPLPPLEREFLTLVLSRAGQEIVGKDGYIALSPRLAQRELSKLQ
ncbi:MAG: PstS family phosphate ABC transporter substrate-binding protein [Pseudomonadales bacterium]